MTFEQAVETAARALAGKADRFGEPDLLHSLRVALSVPEDARAVGVLHDVVEDSDVTLDDLVRLGLSEVEVEAVKLLTHDDDDDPYADYIERVATADGEAGRLARIVKLADVRDNLGRTRPEMEHLRERYEQALKRLTR